MFNLTDIGEGASSALICQTDSTQCCRVSDNTNGGTPLGNWYFPNGSLVRNSDVGGDIYMDRDLSEVRLNRRNNATSQTGVYRCEVVDARGSTQNIFVELQTCKFQILQNLVGFFSPVDACIDTSILYHFKLHALMLLQFHHPLQPTWPLPPSLSHPSPSPGSSQLGMLLTDMT